MSQGANRWRRFADWDERPLRLDNFAAEDPANGFAAFSSPADPKPAVAVKAGEVVMMDGIAAADFDMIDLFIARYHLTRQSPKRPWRSRPKNWLACWSIRRCRVSTWCAWRTA